MCEEKTVLSNLMYFYSAFEVCVKKFISYYIWISPKFLRLFEIQEPELSLYNQYNHRLSDTMCHRDTFVFHFENYSDILSLAIKTKQLLV